MHCGASEVRARGSEQRPKQKSGGRAVVWNQQVGVGVGPRDSKSNYEQLLS